MKLGDLLYYITCCIVGALVGYGVVAFFEVMFS